MTALFVVESPLQMINANEAREHFSIPREQAFLVIKRGVSTENQRQTAALCNPGEWHTILEIGDPKGIFGFLACNWAISRWRRRHALRPKKIFIGDYRSRYMRHVANSFSGKLVLLDDGASTLAVAESRRRGKSYAVRYTGLKRYFNKQSLLGYRDGDIPSITYFSAYEFDVPEHDRVIGNQYMRLRAGLGSYPVEQSWYFIGSPLVEAGIVNGVDYLAALKIISTHYDKPVFYIPHRREADGSVLELCKELGWKMRRFDRPLELEMVESERIPLGILGLYSNALPGISRIFGARLQVHSYYLPASSITKHGLRDQIEAVYRYYAQHYAGEAFRLFNIDGAPFKLTLGLGNETCD